MTCHPSLFHQDCLSSGSTIKFVSSAPTMLRIPHALCPKGPSLVLQPLHVNSPLHKLLLHRPSTPQPTTTHLNHHPQNDIDFVEYVTKLDTTLGLAPMNNLNTLSFVHLCPAPSMCRKSTRNDVTLTCPRKSEKAALISENVDMC